MNNTTKLVVGMAVAAAAGAALGMLLAPEKGSDLQKRIKDGASDWLKEFNNLMATGRDVVNQARLEHENMPNDDMNVEVPDLSRRN